MVEHFRRTDPRYDRILEVEILLDGKRQVVASKDISLGGIFVETSDPIPIHTTVQVRFKVPTQPEVIDVTGEVRWLEPPKGSAAHGMGIRFHGLRARDVWALNRFFQG